MSDIKFLREQLSAFSRRSYERGLVAGTGGNLSIRIPNTDTVLVTPTEISLGDVEPDENILVNLEGEIIDSPLGLKGSKETGFHLIAYRLRPDVGAIVHVHPPYATAYANKMQPLPMSTVSAMGKLKHVPCIRSLTKFRRSSPISCFSGQANDRSARTSSAPADNQYTTSWRKTPGRKNV